MNIQEIIYDNVDDAEISIIRLSEITRYIHELLSTCFANDFDYTPIESLLIEWDASKMSSFGIVGTLRTLYPLRDKLQNYSLFLEASKQRLIALNKDYERILRGLL